MDLAFRKLIQKARAARSYAVASFSNFRVGAALESQDGRIFTGCNIENATYGLTICAERVAVFKALSEGCPEFTRIAVVTDANKLTPPCGACRQVLWEFCGDIEVILTDLKGKTDSIQLGELFPRPFDASFL